MYDVIVVGGASAGLTAAMYASRQGLKTLVITKDIGGQALLTNDIENYPAFEHVGGFELMNKFEKQAKNFGAEFVYEEVSSIQKDLKQLASKVIIIHRGDRPIGSEETIDLLQRQQFNGKISFIANSIVKSVNGRSKVESLTLFNSKTNSEFKIEVDGIFVEMGYIAKTDIVKDLVQLNSNQ
jgi:thioredoxin reductase